MGEIEILDRLLDDPQPANVRHGTLDKAPLFTGATPGMTGG